MAFFTLAFTAKVMLPALKVALVVGSILAFINHGGAIVRMDFDGGRLLQVLLSYMVPYCVSIYSAVKAIQSHDRTRT